MANALGMDLFASTEIAGEWYQDIGSTNPVVMSSDVLCPGIVVVVVMYGDDVACILTPDGAFVVAACLEPEHVVARMDVLGAVLAPQLLSASLVAGMDASVSILVPGMLGGGGNVGEILASGFFYLYQDGYPLIIDASADPSMAYVNFPDDPGHSSIVVGSDPGRGNIVISS